MGKVFYGNEYGISKIDNELNYLRYRCKSKEMSVIKAANIEFNEMWKYLKNNTAILKDAIEIIKNKFNETTLRYTTICDTMLCYSKDIDSEIYLKLVDEIYSDKSIARIVVDGYTNGGYSFLLYTLMDYDLKLTDEQKFFAIDEALNKPGTKRSMHNRNDKSITAQAHGKGYFDIRYHILFNDNFTDEEKEKFIYEAYANNETWDEALEQWIFNLQYDYTSIVNRNIPFEQILNFTDDEIRNIVGDKHAEYFIRNTKIINFLRGVRPQYADETIEKINNGDQKLTKK